MQKYEFHGTNHEKFLFSFYIVERFMGRITKRFFNGDGQNGESCLFIGSYGWRFERGK